MFLAWTYRLRQGFAPEIEPVILDTEDPPEHEARRES